MNKPSVVLGVLISCCCLAPLPGVWAQSAAQPASTGQLQFRVVIVDELTPKPVPFTDFVITAQSGDRTRLPVRTDE